MKYDLPRTTLLCCMAGLSLLAAGCNKFDPPPFRLNMVEAVTNETSPEYQQEIANVLGALFGTPDAPIALPETGLDASRLRMAAGPAYSNEKGVHHGLYRRHCVHCHGVTGDGRGPTGRFLNPYPRDYRQGVFKFKSTYSAARPTDEDLHRVLTNGIQGTAMPTFSLLPASEAEALVEYVKYLAMRGEMERALIAFVFDELGEEEEEDENGKTIMVRPPLDPTADEEQREVILDMLTEIATGWDDAESQVIVPVENEIPADHRSQEELDASIAKGRELFFGKLANCAKCHGPTGLGDGQRDDQDLWNKAHKKFITDTASQAESIEDLYSNRSEEKDPDIKKEMGREIETKEAFLASREEIVDALYPVRNAMPRNLRKGIYRGGRRRIDVFRRIAAGIPGTPMPGSGSASPGAKGTITEADIWNIVDYVVSLPYEGSSQPQQALPVNEDQIF